jgi:hypothetical protein
MNSRPSIYIYTPSITTSPPGFAKFSPLLGGEEFTLASFSHTCVSARFRVYLVDYNVRYHSASTPTCSHFSVTRLFGCFTPAIRRFRHANEDTILVYKRVAIPMKSSLRISTLYTNTCVWLRWTRSASRALRVCTSVAL